MLCWLLLYSYYNTVKLKLQVNKVSLHAHISSKYLTDEHWFLPAKSLSAAKTIAAPVAAFVWHFIRQGFFYCQNKQFFI